MKGRNKKFHADGNQEREGVAIKQTFTQNQSLETERSILTISQGLRTDCDVVYKVLCTLSGALHNSQFFKLDFTLINV